MKKRIEIVDEKEIHIVDDILSTDEIEAFYEYACELPFKRSERSFAADQFPIFSVDFDSSRFDDTSFIGQKARGLLELYCKNASQYKLGRSYINMSNYGDVEFPHYDCAPEKDDITVLYYVNKEWNYKYGGETMFYSGKDTRLAILPTPGRFVIFSGNIEHMGSIATRICKEPRLSLALKYKLDQ